MKIPEEKIQEIRSAIDIVEYIGQFVRLKKRGKDYTGLCPFHNEKTPSFTVSANKQMYYCFGCHRGGDVVKFVMEFEKSSYVEALEILAEKAGIEITRTEDVYQSASETEKLFSICSTAARFFYNNLIKSEEGKFALQYFAQRGFSEKTIVTFGLGYSLKSWDGFINFAREQGIALDNAEKVGLVRKRDDGTYYDTFRGRAMFPVFNTTGKVIAFGARKIYDDDSVAGKYINSPETPIYHKSKILYGISQAKEAIRSRDFVVLVEGYADLISVFQSGTKNVVASSGTALTPEQIQLISRYTKNITLVFDSDSAGANAMLRGVDLILENGLDVRIVQLPHGDDPDSFVKNNGGEAFEELLQKAVTFVDFKANTFIQSGKFETPEGKAEAVRGIVQTIAKIPDSLKRSFFLKDVAEKYSLYESTLYNELEKLTRKTPERFTRVVDDIQKENEQVQSERREPAEIPVDEREIFSVIFEDPENMIRFIFQHIGIQEFSHTVSRTLCEHILDFYDTHGVLHVTDLMNTVEDDAVKQIIANIAFNRYQLSERWDTIGSRLQETRLYEIALGAIKSIKRKNLEKQLAEVRLQMKNAALNGEDSVPFLRKQHEILLSIKEVDGIKLAKPPEENDE